VLKFLYAASEYPIQNKVPEKFALFTQYAIETANSGLES